MGSAPVRRDSDTRLESSLRRGAYVGPGMSGVYAVRHHPGQALTLPAADASVTFGDWVQPDSAEQDISGGQSYVLATVRGNPGLPADFSDEAEATMLRLREVFASDLTQTVGSSYQRDGGGDTSQPVATLMHMVIPPSALLGMPAIPPSDADVLAAGADGYVLESSTGVATALLVEGVIESSEFEGATIRQATEAQWTPDDSVFGITYSTPGELSGQSVLTTAPGDGDPYSVTPTIDGNGGAVLVLAWDGQVSGVGWDVLTTAFLNFHHIPGDPLATLTATYTPPRYRFYFLT